MLDRARKVRDSRISLATSLDEFNQELKKVGTWLVASMWFILNLITIHSHATLTQGNLILTPWCELKSTEEMVKESTKASTAAAASAKVEVDSGSGEAFEQLSGAAKVGCSSVRDVL